MYPTQTQSKNLTDKQRDYLLHCIICGFGLAALFAIVAIWLGNLKKEKAESSAEKSRVEISSK